MESRRNPRRDTSETTGRPPYPTRPEEEGSGPGALFEAPGEEVDTPEQHHPTGPAIDEDDDDFDGPEVLVTHSLHGQYTAAPEQEFEPEPEPPILGSRAGAPGKGEGEEPAEREAAHEEPEKGAQDVTEQAPPITDAAPEPRARTESNREPAAAAPPPAPANTRFSPDGEWWWNGAYWLPAVSPDGLWRWDGARWVLQVASGLEPERLVEGLNQLAEVRYRRRGLLLARHAIDWPVPPQLTQPVAEATEILEQRAATERRLQTLDAPGGNQQRRIGGLLGRGSEEEHRRVRTELANMNAHLEPRLLRIGQEAPMPTFREADEVLETAQHLAEAAREVTTAHEAVLAAQAEWQARVAAATADLEHRIAERDARIAEADVAIREAEARRERRIADAWRHLAEVRMPGKGEHLASFGPVHLFAARIEMPNAAGPAAGARAVIGSAAELTRTEPDALEDLFLVGDSGAADLHWAETNADPTPYLLVITECGCALMPCGENEGEARRFARQLAAAAATADAMREARRARLAQAREAVQQAEDDHSEIEAARAHRAATERDPELLRAIEQARDQLERERQETTEIDQTGAVLQGVLDRLTTAPEPLPTAGAG